ncbi:MAG: Ig-like domain-containing protein, partial [Anaerolineales bacterium]
MNKRLFPLISFVLIASFLLASCGPVTALPPVTATLPPATPPDVQVQADQIRPYILEQDPPAGQRLALSSGFRVVFDRDMDQERTSAAFSFLDSQQEPVAGQRSWPDSRTFSFNPNPGSSLRPFTRPSLPHPRPPQMEKHSRTSCIWNSPPPTRWPSGRSSRPTTPRKWISR